MFVDRHYNFTHIHSLKYQTGDEADEAKEYFEEYAESHGIEIKHYHSDNGIFRSTLWMNHFK